MSHFTVNQEICKRDGICAETCPLGLIERKDDQSFPVPTEDAEMLCVECGHCVAVCPHGALSLGTITPEQCPPIRKEWLLTPEQAEHFLRSRRSIRVYKNNPVDKGLIKRLIEIARYAPSGHNSQPVEWLVIYDNAEVQTLAGIVIDWMRYMIKEQSDVANFLHMDRVVDQWEKGKDAVCRKAPHVIIAHASKENRMAPVASATALAYMEVAAPSLGLGTCWAGYFNTAATLWPPMLKALALPEDHISYGAMMIGYPKYKYHRLPPRKEPQILWR
jgi:nitroreductase/NAD-dependent dihydropyrimidine dehydrogenase PreA subunit